MGDRSTLNAARSVLLDLEQWIDDNMDRVRTPTFRRVLLAHRLLFDLIAGNGGSPKDRTDVMRELTVIHAGERDPEKTQSIG